jgi:hypothetical protein
MTNQFQRSAIHIENNQLIRTPQREHLMSECNYRAGQRRAQVAIVLRSGAENRALHYHSAFAFNAPTR